MSALGQRPSALLGCGLLLLLACSANAERTPSTLGGAGTGGAAGSPGSAGASTLRTPVAIVEGPEVVGASPVACEGSPAPDPALVRACLLAASCTLVPQVAAVSECIALALPQTALFPECMQSALSCDEVAECLGKGLYPEPCPAGADGPTCVDTSIVKCPSAIPEFEDCARRGAFCAEYEKVEDGVSTKGADCAVRAPCSPESQVHVCEGTKRVLCHQGIGFGEDCAARGLACVETPEGAICAEDPPTCERPGSGSCNASGDGSYCADDGRTLALECSRLGFTCLEDPERPFGVECVDPECSAQDAAQCFEECDGPMAHLCLGGQRFSVDCEQHGLPDCILEVRADTGARAACGYN